MEIWRKSDPRCATNAKCYIDSPHSCFRSPFLSILGFSVLQVQGPCPFRIEVTNSFVHPHPPTETVGQENVLSTNRGGVNKKEKSCQPDPVSGLFGTMSYNTTGHTNTGKQRAPINTTPNPAVSTREGRTVVVTPWTDEHPNAVRCHHTFSAPTGETIKGGRRHTRITPSAIHASIRYSVHAL